MRIGFPRTGTVVRHPRPKFARPEHEVPPEPDTTDKNTTELAYRRGAGIEVTLLNQNQPGRHGGFARDFATADGQRVLVTALTWQQFADLAHATRLAGAFAFLERVLQADFSTRDIRDAVEGELR